MWQREWYDEWHPRDPELAEGLGRGGRARPQPHRPERIHHGHRRPGAGTAPPRPGSHRGRPGWCWWPTPVSCWPVTWSNRGTAVVRRLVPIDLADTVHALLHLATSATVIPGHGALVDADFVRAQHDELTELSRLIRAGHADNAPAAEVAAKSAVPARRRGGRGRPGLPAAKQPDLNCRTPVARCRHEPTSDVTTRYRTTCDARDWDAFGMLLSDDVVRAPARPASASGARRTTSSSTAPTRALGGSASSGSSATTATAPAGPASSSARTRCRR